MASSPSAKTPSPSAVKPPRGQSPRQASQTGSRAQVAVEPTKTAANAAPEATVGKAATARRKAAAAGASRQPGSPGVRALAAQATREAILKAATKVFAKHGYDGGRIEQISKAAKSYDRMIYYYFGSKEGLFIAVLEDTYRRFNDAEAALELNEQRPLDALTAVIRFIWTYYQRNPDFITLLNTENLYRGKHIVRSERAREYSSPAIAITDRVLRAGAEQGLFRPELSARDVYLTIAALAYFYLGNRYTLSAFLGENLEAPEALAHWEGFVIDSVMRVVRTAPG